MPELPFAGRQGRPMPQMNPQLRVLPLSTLRGIHRMFLVLIAMESIDLTLTLWRVFRGA